MTDGKTPWVMTPIEKALAESLWAANGFEGMHPEGLWQRPDYIKQQYAREAIDMLRALNQRGWRVTRQPRRKETADAEHS